MRRSQIIGLVLIVIGIGAGIMIYTITRSGIDKIKRHEALRLEPYKDAADKWTIGYGHLLLPGEWWNKITEPQAEDLLRKDLAIAESNINTVVKVPLNKNQYDALVSFVFNIGINAFTKSTLLRKLNAGDYVGATNEFKRWKYAGGKINTGLITRRQREETLFTLIA